MKLVQRRRKLREILADETGQATIEYMLLILAFVVPSILVFNMLLDVLVMHYRTVTFLQTLPFP